MKNLSLAAVLMMLAVLFTTTVFAQKPKSKPEVIKEIVVLTNSKKPEDIQKGYLLCKDFLKRFGSDTDEPVVHIKKFVVSYRNDLFLKAVDGNKYADAEKNRTPQRGKPGLLRSLRFANHRTQGWPLL